MANMRDLHGFAVACLNPRSLHHKSPLMRHLPECNGCQGARTTFPSSRVSREGQTRNPCPPFLFAAPGKDRTRPEEYPPNCREHSAVLLDFPSPRAANRVSHTPCASRMRPFPQGEKPCT